jgi:hypothetical protein
VERAAQLKDADAVEHFLGELEVARHIALAKLTHPVPGGAPPDDVLTLQAAALLVGGSTRWVRQHARELGARQVGRKLIFSRRRLLERK